MGPAFDETRFREAVLYVSWRMKDNQRFGRLKLAKTLFYADFESYADDGSVVTGARYEHFPNGPFPPALYNVIDKLTAAGTADVVGGEFEGDELRLIPAQSPTTPHLNAYQRALLDLKMDELAGVSSGKVSDDSHDHPGWLLTADREEIPYAAALRPTPPSQSALGLARQRFA